MLLVGDWSGGGGGIAASCLEESSGILHEHEKFIFFFELNCSTLGHATNEKNICRYTGVGYSLACRHLKKRRGSNLKVLNRGNGWMTDGTYIP